LWFCFFVFDFWFMKKGLTLVEVLIGMAIFVMVSTAVYQAFAKIFDLVASSRSKNAAIALGNEQLEIIRNLPYADVGIVGGLPAGKIPASQNLVRDFITFNVRATIRSIDDPFDGTLGGAPNDVSPADYKLAQVDITCALCRYFGPVKLTTVVAPKNLETASTNGALFIRVLDANGQPVSGANVHIENNKVAPPIVIDDTANNQGLLQIVDVPPGVEAYEITVSKPNYSTEKTYTPGLPGNPNPTKPHATVALQQVTQISFAIDKVSTISVISSSQTCSPIASIPFTIQGNKIIGTSPDVLKYTQNLTTDAQGTKTINNLEWDTYNLTTNSAGYDFAGSIPLTPLNLSPNTTQNLKLIMTPKNPLSLLVLAQDSATGLPVGQASALLEKAGYSNTLITGQGFLLQTDWSGGAGQADFVDATKYFSSDGNIDIANPTGEVQLKKTLGQYASSAWLISSTFDTGSAGNFYQFNWQPTSQPPLAGADSVKFQIATNNDNATWNFVGPDGTGATFYILANQNISATHNGTRYLRYKMFLQTQDTSVTPDVSVVSFTFSSDCVPQGQVLFSGLSSGAYTLTVSKTGYQPVTTNVAVTSSWQQQQITLTP